jgi:AraC family transcriptional regulator, transcriptional activator FtrA
MHTVAVAVVGGTAQFELAVACEVFGTDRSWMFDDWYAFKLCAAEPGPVRTAAGLVLDTPYGIDDLITADTVIVPAAGEAPGQHAPLIDAIRQAYANGARIASICTGAFLLAEAGLLDGRRATTHWAHAAELASRYPEIDVDPNVLYVQDGRIFTSAGTAAGIDLCLHMLRLDLGTDAANAVARRMVVPPHRNGGQAQYVDAPLPPCDSDTLAPILDWALARLEQQVTLRDMADHANISVRTLVRRFTAATGTTPLQWLLIQRVRRAQHLLESSDQPIERIASLAGFGTAANLRQHFTRIMVAPPMHYRRTFRGEHPEGEQLVSA